MAIAPSAGALFRDGLLAEAVAAATSRVRAAPGDGAARVLLAELLLFAGSLERCDGQLDTASTVDSSLGIAVAEFRQLLRAEQARVQLFTAGRVPEFLDSGPTEAQRAALACVVAMRAGDLLAAAQQAEAAEQARAKAAFHIDDRLVDDVRDADDVIGGSLEVLTPTGKYFWIPFERVISLTPRTPERPRDLYWRLATLEIADGPSGDVYIPALYRAGEEETDNALRLGRATDWRELADGLTRGRGQRLFLVGDEGLAMTEFSRLERAG